VILEAAVIAGSGGTEAAFERGDGEGRAAGDCRVAGIHCTRVAAVRRDERDGILLLVAMGDAGGAHGGLSSISGVRGMADADRAVLRCCADGGAL